MRRTRDTVRHETDKKTGSVKRRFSTAVSSGGGSPGEGVRRGRPPVGTTDWKGVGGVHRSALPTGRGVQEVLSDLRVR